MKNSYFLQLTIFRKIIIYRGLLCNNNKNNLIIIIFLKTIFKFKQKNSLNINNN